MNELLKFCCVEGCEECWREAGEESVFGIPPEEEERRRGGAGGAGEGIGEEEEEEGGNAGNRAGGLDDH